MLVVEKKKVNLEECLFCKNLNFFFSHQRVQNRPSYFNDYIKQIIMVLNAKTELRISASLPLLLLERYTSFYLSLSDKGDHYEEGQGLN
jgi:hypothetical protein